MASAAVSRGASAMAMTATARPSRATWMVVRPSPASSAARSASPSSEMPSRSSSRALPIARRRPSTVATAPWPGTASNVSTRGGSQSAFAARPRRSPLRAGARFRARPPRQAAAPRPRHAISGRDGDDLRLAARQRAGLVEHDGVERGGLLQREGVLEQDAALGAQPGADHDRRRCRQPERVGAGDDDDGDREQQRVLHVAADDEVPGREGRRPPTRATSTSQNAARSASRWPGAFEFCASWTSLHDLGERGVRPDGGRACTQCAVDVDRRADELVARALVHRQALSGNRRLVDLALALFDKGIDRASSSRDGSTAGRRPGPRPWGPRPARHRAAPPPWAAPGRADARIASFAPPRARISNQWPSSTNVASIAAAS